MAFSVKTDFLWFIWNLFSLSLFHKIWDFIITCQRCASFYGRRAHSINCSWLESFHHQPDIQSAMVYDLFLVRCTTSTRERASTMVATASVWAGRRHRSIQADIAILEFVHCRGDRQRPRLNNSKFTGDKNPRDDKFNHRPVQIISKNQSKRNLLGSKMSDFDTGFFILSLSNSWNKETLFSSKNPTSSTTNESKAKKPISSDVLRERQSWISSLLFPLRTPVRSSCEADSGVWQLDLWRMSRSVERGARELASSVLLPSVWRRRSPVSSQRPSKQQEQELDELGQDSAHRETAQWRGQEAERGGGTSGRGDSKTRVLQSRAVHHWAVWAARGPGLRCRRVRRRTHQQDPKRPSSSDQRASPRMSGLSQDSSLGSAADKWTGGKQAPTRDRQGVERDHSIRPQMERLLQKSGLVGQRSRNGDRPWQSPICPPRDTEVRGGIKTRGHQQETGPVRGKQLVLRNEEIIWENWLNSWLSQPNTRKKTKTKTNSS